MRYRPEIDGLRAVAIVPVVLFHAGVTFVSGGFVGVDVFFVISGFLITGLLVQEYNKSGRINIAEFYARRVRRLLPALLVVIVTTLLLSSIFLPPTGEQQSLAWSAFNALFFTSNVYFWQTQSGYFAEAAEFLPLLHTWTLAAEEQFYIFWPLLIITVGIAAKKLKSHFKKTLLVLMMVVILVSFVLSLWATSVRPTAAFYLTPMRAWEFLLGALLVVIITSNVFKQRVFSSFIGDFLSVGGLVAIGYSLYTFDESTAFPGYYALIPVLGTVALLGGTSISPSSMIVKALAMRPLTFIGKISYSWYLWHWPLIALLNVQSLDNPPASSMVLAVGASLLLSIASYYWVEKPIRTRTPGPFGKTKGTLIAGFSLLVMGGVSAFALHQSADSQLQKSPLMQGIFEAKHAKLDWPAHCSHYQYPFSGLASLSGCFIGDIKASKTIVLWGDSHAHHLIPLLDEYGKKAKVRIIPRTRGGCRPLNGDSTVVGFERTEQLQKGCEQFNSAVVEQLSQLAKEGAVAVVMASRWPLDTTAEHANWINDLKKSIEAVSSQGMKTIVVGDVPEFEYSIPKCLLLRSNEGCSQPRILVDKKRAVSVKLLQEIEKSHSNVYFWDLINGVCNTEDCYVLQGGIVLYKDSHHLSLIGSRKLEMTFRELLSTLLKGKVTLRSIH